MINRDLYIHTNLPAPYRKHMFEAFAKEFRRVVAIFTWELNKNTRWDYNLRDWAVDCRNVQSSWVLAGMLLTQRWGSVHLWGGGGNLAYGMLLIFSGLIGHSRLIAWNDAGFPDKVYQRHKRSVAHIILHSLNVVRLYFWRKACQFVFTPGKLGLEYSRAIGFPDDKIVNAYFSHDVDLFMRFCEEHYEEARGDVRRELGIGKDKIVFLNISRYLDWKRLEDLADSLLILEREHPSEANQCELILIGDGKYTMPLTRLRELTRVKVHVIHHMYQDRLLTYYCASDLFVFPSEGDIWGLVVNEALSMRLPVVCTDRIGSSELVRTGVNGFKVATRSPEELASCVYLLLDYDLRKKFSENARKGIVHWRTEYGIRGLVERLSHL